jgi:hemolysin III
MPEKNKTTNKHLIEEKLNSITHSIGAGMSIAGLVFLLILTGMNSGGASRYVSFSLYGAFQI